MLAAEQYRLHRQAPTRVLSYSALRNWTYHNGGEIITGQLSRRSYRCRWFAVIAIKGSDQQHHYVPIMRDAIDGPGFSMLQMHLKFAEQNQPRH